MLIHAPWPRPGGQPCRGLIQARLGIQHVQAADSEGAREQGEEENMTGDASAAACPRASVGEGSTSSSLAHTHGNIKQMASRMTLFGSWLAMALCWRKGKR